VPLFWSFFVYFVCINSSEQLIIFFLSPPSGDLAFLGFFNSPPATPNSFRLTPTPLLFLTLFSFVFISPFKSFLIVCSFRFREQFYCPNLFEPVYGLQIWLLRLSLANCFYSGRFSPLFVVHFLLWAPASLPLAGNFFPQNIGQTPAPLSPFGAGRLAGLPLSFQHTLKKVGSEFSPFEDKGFPWRGTVPIVAVYIHSAEGIHPLPTCKAPPNAPPSPSKSLRVLPFSFWLL